MDGTLVPTTLSLKIDPSVLERKWYEKISVFTALSLGNGIVGNPSLGFLGSAGFGYDFTSKINVGVNITPVLFGGVQVYYRIICELSSVCERSVMEEKGYKVKISGNRHQSKTPLFCPYETCGRITRNARR
jgi:hypothetical protein